MMKNTPVILQILAAGLAMGFSLSAELGKPAIASFNPANFNPANFNPANLVRAKHSDDKLSVMTNKCLPECVASTSISPDLLASGKAFYQASQFADAVRVLAEAAEIYASEGDVLKQAVALVNLSLAYQQLGQWEPANLAISQSLNILAEFEAKNQEVSRIKAQVLEIYGAQQLQQGNPETALSIWQDSAKLYGEVGDEIGQIRSNINQAQAQQSLGLYRQSRHTLAEVQSTLANQPDTLVKAVALRSLGETLRVLGDLESSRKYLEESLKIARKFRSATDIEAALLTLGNTARYLSLRLEDLADRKVAASTDEINQLKQKAAQEIDIALTAYQEVANSSQSRNLRMQAKLNILQVLIETKQGNVAEKIAGEISETINELSPSRESVYAYINYSQSLAKLTQPSNQNSPREILRAKLLARAAQMANSLQDRRAESLALGNLGNLYAAAEQWAEAKSITEQALMLAQVTNAPEITYQWQWQLGRILKSKNDREGAIAAYGEAVNTLQGLRRDLVAINQDQQFDFRDRVELVYREFVDLLLSETTPSQKNLQTARKTIEGLQLAELDNFFRDACLDVQPKQIDQIDAKATVIYPIILADRLEIILALPDQSLRHHSQKISQFQIEKMLDYLQDDVSNRRKISSDIFLADAQKLYDWLIRPFANDLESNHIQTLVFVLDGGLRNIPMAVLHDGEKYLIEKYAIALTPGLQLLPSQGLQTGKLQALTAGLSEAREGFSTLENVEAEIQEINREFPTQSLLNEQFTKTQLQTLIDLGLFPVVHIATHGQFGSVAEDTFILTWNERINSKELGNILQPSDPGNRRSAIELLVLSACETATGDRRAGLGLAGVAVRSEARSTIATLWQVNDQSSAALMMRFYQELAQGNVSKGEALRRAQVSILRDSLRDSSASGTIGNRPEYAHPYFWAAYVLVGNWL
jgi:CHAT domain-containing protein